MSPGLGLFLLGSHLQSQLPAFGEKAPPSSRFDSFQNAPLDSFAPPRPLLLGDLPCGGLAGTYPGRLTDRFGKCIHGSSAGALRQVLEQPLLLGSMDGA